MAKSRWKNGIPNSVRQKIKDKEKMAKIRAKIEKGSKPKVRVKTPAIPTIENPKGKFTKIRNIPEETTAEDILAALNKAGKSGNLERIGMINIADEPSYSLDGVVYTDNGKKLIATKWEGEWGVISMDEFLGKPEKGLVPTDKPVPIKVKKPTRAAINAFKGLLIAGGLSGFAPTSTQIYDSPTMSATENKHGWVHVKMFDEKAGVDSSGRWIDFNMRKKDWYATWDKTNRYGYKDIDSMVRSTWRKGYKQGGYYSSLRNVEGALKHALRMVKRARTQDERQYWEDNVYKWSDVLDTNNPALIDQIWKEWCEIMGNEGVEAYFENDSPEGKDDYYEFITDADEGVVSYVPEIEKTFL